jgi:hypothetical protein
MKQQIQGLNSYKLVVEEILFIVENSLDAHVCIYVL